MCIQLLLWEIKPIEALFLVKMLVTSRAIGAQIKPASVKIALTVI